METVRKVTRKSIPLSARDLEDLESMRSASSRREALTEASGRHIPENASDALLLHAVWEAGVRAVQDRLEAQGYAEIAAQQDAAQRRKAARRRRPSWADEA